MRTKLMALVLALLPAFTFAGFNAETTPTVAPSGDMMDVKGRASWPVGADGNLHRPASDNNGVMYISPVAPVYVTGVVGITTTVQIQGTVSVTNTVTVGGMGSLSTTAALLSLEATQQKVWSAVEGISRAANTDGIRTSFSIHAATLETGTAGLPMIMDTFFDAPFEVTTAWHHESLSATSGFQAPHEVVFSNGGGPMNNELIGWCFWKDTPPSDSYSGITMSVGAQPLAYGPFGPGYNASFRGISATSTVNRHINKIR